MAVFRPTLQRGDAFPNFIQFQTTITPTQKITDLHTPIKQQQHFDLRCTIYQKQQQQCHNVSHNYLFNIHKLYKNRMFKTLHLRRGSFWGGTQQSRK